MNITELNRTKNPQYGASVGSSILRQHFGSPTNVFKIVVPDSYSHETVIDDYVRCHEVNERHNTNILITNDNYKKATCQLQAGYAYKIEIIPILKQVWGEDCCNYMRDKDYLLTGAQGLFLALQIKSNNLSVKNSWVASFDEEHALPLESNGYYKVPVLYDGCKSGNGSWNKLHNNGFRLSQRPFCSPWQPNDYLLCYSEE